MALLAAKMVGAEGEVVGIDRDRDALKIASGRVREAGLANTTFVAGDFAAIGPEHGVFDAAVGRRVLMYQTDPVVALRAVITVLRPGALVVFQEADATMVPASRVPLPLNARANRWMWQTVEREGGNIHMGFDLARALEQAGLVVAEVRAEGIVQTPKLRHPVGMIIRAMLPHPRARRRHGSGDRRRHPRRAAAADRGAANATYVGDMAFGAWARVPAK